MQIFINGKRRSYYFIEFYEMHQKKSRGKNIES